MKATIPIVLAILIAVVSGWAHGVVIDRWGVPTDVARVAERLEKLTIEIDGWESKPGQELNAQTRKLAGAEGYFSTHYTDEKTGASVAVAVLCGRPGPISLHAPTVCFVNAGMQQMGRESRALVPDFAEASPNFWMVDFRPPSSNPGPDIRTFWSWSADGKNWEAAEDPRFKFASAPYLYRMYFTIPSAVFAPTPDDEGPSTVEIQVQDFLDRFLAEFAKAVGDEPS